MKEIKRFDLADCASPERIVDEIIRKVAEMPIPVPIEELALMLDIISIEELETEGYEGGLLTDEEKSEGVILINKTSSVPRRRFTTGHELGHFLCPTHKPKDGDQFRCSYNDIHLTFVLEGDRVARMEAEANRFAALLLMPLPYFRNDIRRRKGAEIEHILTLAARYLTSKEATARRYVDVQDEPCTIIVSQNSQILRFYRGKDFPFLDVKPGDRVPKYSLTSNTDLPVGGPSEAIEMDGRIWLSEQWGRRSPAIYEQVLPQSNGYRMTLLSLAEDPEEIEEEEELIKSWMPKFKR